MAEEKDGPVDLLAGFYLPPPPKLFVEMRNAFPDLNKMADVLATDPGLVVKVLQTVNSPAFGLRERVASIQKATVILGLDWVLNIVSGVMLREVSDEIDKVDLEKFWKLSNDVALCCTAVSKATKLSRPDEMYVLGLFHNCGIPFILKQYDKYYAIAQESYRDSQARIEVVEGELMALSHAHVSYLIAKSWFLPDHICRAINFHHCVDKLNLRSNNEKVRRINEAIVVLKIAEHMCEVFGCIGGETVDYEWNRSKERILNFMGYSDERLDLLCESVMEIFERTIFTEVFEKQA